jgi:hypothetical protein
MIVDLTAPRNMIAKSRGMYEVIERGNVMKTRVEKLLYAASTTTSSAAAGIDRNHSLNNLTDRSFAVTSSLNRIIKRALGASWRCESLRQQRG